MLRFTLRVMLAQRLGGAIMSLRLKVGGNFSLQILDTELLSTDVKTFIRLGYYFGISSQVRLLRLGRSWVDRLLLSGLIWGQSSRPLSRIHSELLIPSMLG